MRQELKPDRISPRRKHPTEPADQLEIPAKSANLAAKFVPWTFRQVIESQRPFVVDDTKSLPHYLHGPVHIIEDRSLGDGPEQLATHRRN